MRLRCIRDDGQAMLSRERQDWIHICRLTEEMHRHDCSSFCRNHFANARRVNIKRVGARFYRNGDRTNGDHCEPRRDVGVGWYDHLMTRADSERTESQLERIQTVADTDSLGRACEFSP